MTKTNNPAITLTFAEERETKNTIRFQEQVLGELDVPQIGTIYLSKALLKDLGWKRGQHVSISVSAE